VLNQGKSIKSYRSKISTEKVNNWDLQNLDSIWVLLWLKIVKKCVLVT
jgi:hypothetical protein